MRREEIKDRQERVCIYGSYPFVHKKMIHEIGHAHFANGVPEEVRREGERDGGHSVHTRWFWNMLITSKTIYSNSPSLASFLGLLQTFARCALGSEVDCLSLVSEGMRFHEFGPGWAWRTISTSPATTTKPGKDVTPHGSFPRRALGVALLSLWSFQDLPLAGSSRLRRRTTSISPATEAIIDKISLDDATEISTKGTF
jgi:hypothetical protein